MTTFISNTRVEHAPEQVDRPLRDRIVLSEAEIDNANAMAYETPRYAMTFLADQAAAGRAVDPRTRARVEKAMEIVVRKGLAAVYEDEKPEPVATHTTTVRRVPALATNAAGNRQIETDELLVQFVEVDDDGSDRDPVVVMDHEQEMAELPYARFVVAHVRFLAAIDPTGYLRGIAEREQAAAVQR